MIDTSQVPETEIGWLGASRIIRSRFPPIDLFEDIADPADWPLLISAEQKTNPRLMETLGNLDLIPPARRVGGPGAGYLMAPFTHVSADRPSRFGDGSFGILYVGDRFEVALLETVHQHERFMACTGEPEGWTSQFRELRLDVHGALRDLRADAFAALLDRDDYTQSQDVGHRLHTAGAEGVVYPSVRYPSGECVGLFFPDLAGNVVQARHFDYHWDGARVDLYRDVGSGEVTRIVD